jgi:molybdate transport system substrate-binding protein
VPRTGRALVALLLGALTLTACGEGADERPVVAAASSLRTALGDVGGARIAFAGSDQLAAQLRSGARIDVFVAANDALPQALLEEGLVDQPVPVATNELVLAVPADGGGRVSSLADLSRPGVRIALGAEGVPVGDLARAVIGRLARPAAVRRRLLANVVSEEPDVAGVVAKVAQGAVDAGFVYATDVRATPRIRGERLPDSADARVTYAAAVVRSGRHRDAARAYLRSLVDGDGARALRRAGFGPVAVG